MQQSKNYLLVKAIGFALHTVKLMVYASMRAPTFSGEELTCDVQIEVARLNGGVVKNGVIP